MAEFGDQIPGLSEVIETFNNEIERMKDSLSVKYTNSETLPTSNELQKDKDISIHKNTLSGRLYLAFNDNGVIKMIEFN